MVGSNITPKHTTRSIRLVWSLKRLFDAIVEFLRRSDQKAFEARDADILALNDLA